MNTRGTAYLGTHRPSSLSCVRISSREAARWRATWINNSILTRATAEAPPLLWKLHLQVNWTFMALKSQCRSFQSLLFGLDFILSAVLSTKALRAGEVHNAETQSGPFVADLALRQTACLLTVFKLMFTKAREPMQPRNLQ